MDLLRIRIDDAGLLTQSARGKIDRIPLEKAALDALAADRESGLRELSQRIPSLREFFGTDGRLSARIDVANEPAKCLTRPLRIYYNIEPNCNLRCSFCGPRDLHNVAERVDEAMERLILQQIADAGAFQVQLSGGEIFLRGRGLFRTLEQTRALGLGVLLATNGDWRKIQRRTEFLRELAQFEHIVEIKVSIDGDQTFHDSVRGTGVYQEAVRTLRDLTGLGFPTRVNSTIFRESCVPEQIEHLARLAKDAGASLQVIPERSCGRALGRTRYELPAPDKLRAYTIRAAELRRELNLPISFNIDIFGGGKALPIYDPGRPFSCGAGLWGFAVTHQGKVYPCGFAIEAGGSKDFYVGEVTKNSLLDLWLHSPVLYEWRHAGKPPGCRNCDHYRNTCWGGCMIQAYVTNGDLSAPDPYAPCGLANSGKP